MVDALGYRGDEGRDVTAISPGEVFSNLWSEDFRMGKPSAAKQRYRALNSGFSRLKYYNRNQNWVLGANPLKWNISVSGGKENNSRASREIIPLVAASEKGKAQIKH